MTTINEKLEIISVLEDSNIDSSLIESIIESVEEKLEPSYVCHTPEELHYAIASMSSDEV